MTRLDLFPLTGRFEAGAVVEAKVLAHDTEDHLTQVGFDGGQVWLPVLNEPPGTPLRLRIRARDIMLAESEPQGISANNVLKGTVTELRHDAGAYVDVQIACGATRLLARITHRSRKRLRVEPGRELIVIIKSINLDRRGGRPPAT